MLEQREAEQLDTLIAAVQTGDAAAFADFYDRLAPLVYGVVARTVGDPASAQDVAREAFVEMWHLAPRFDASRRSVRAWACTIAHCHAVDHMRTA